MLATLRQRNFALLWAGGLISMLGDWMLFVGLPLFVYQLTGSTLATGGMFMARLLPSLLLGSVAGVFADRWDRRRLMIVANLLLALGLLPLLAVRSADRLWIVYLVSFWEASVAQFFRPAEGALLPRLVGEEHLVPANALNALNNDLARLAGPPLGALVAGLLGLGGVVLLDAASFLIAALLIALIAIPAGSATRPAGSPTGVAPAAVTQAWTGVWRDWLAGLRLVRRERQITVLFLFIAITGLGEGVFSTLLVPFVATVLGGGGAAYGWLLAAQAVGGLLGGVVIGRLGGAVAPARLLGLGALGLGVGDLLIFTYPLFLPGVTLALLLMVLVGVPATGIGVGLMTLQQTVVADAYRGRLFGAFGTTRALVGLLGAALGGALGDRAGIVLVLSLQGFGYILGGALVLALLRDAVAGGVSAAGTGQEAPSTSRS